MARLERVREQGGQVSHIPSRALSRRALLRHAAGVGAGALSARGLYEAIDQFAVAPPRAEAAVVRRRQEQYLVDSI